MKELQNAAECSRSDCKLKFNELDTLMQKKVKQIYDLTVRLGCIDQENKELKVLIEDKVNLFEGRMETQRQLAEQDISEATSQIESLRKMLDEAEERLKQRSRKIELKLWVNLVCELCMPSAPPRLFSFSCRGYDIGCHDRN